MKEAAFAKGFQEFRNRIEIFDNLLFETLSNPQLREKLDRTDRAALPAPGEKGSPR